MAQLKDLLVSGAARFINGVFTSGTSYMTDVNPSADDTYSLGSDSFRWRKITTGEVSTDSLALNGNVTISGTYNMGSAASPFNNIFSTTFTGSLAGNASTATTATTAKTVAKAFTVVTSAANLAAGEVVGVTGVDSGTRLYSKWFVKLDTEETTPYDGMLIAIKAPTAGVNSGVCITLDKTNFHPIIYQTNSAVTTHFGINTKLLLMYDSGVSCSVYGNSTGTGATSAAAISGCWRVMNTYNTNSDTYTSVYCNTAAGDGTKKGICSGYKLLNNSYSIVTVANTNSYIGPMTLNINSTGAKTIYINGTAASSTNTTLPAGQYLVFYHDNIFYFRTDGLLTILSDGVVKAFDGRTGVGPNAIGGPTNPIYWNGTEFTLCDTFDFNLPAVIGYSAIGSKQKAIFWNGNAFEACDGFAANKVLVGGGSNVNIVPSSVLESYDSYLKCTGELKFQSAGTLINMNNTLLSLQNAPSGDTTNTLFKLTSSLTDYNIFTISHNITTSKVSSVYFSVRDWNVKNTSVNTSNDAYLKITAGYNGAIAGGSVSTNVSFSSKGNDYAEFRKSNFAEPGRCMMEVGDDTLQITSERMSHFAGIISDTYGFTEGAEEEATIPIAVSGRVLAYPYQDRDNYHPGDCVCAAPNGTVDIMTREEVINNPDKIVGKVSCVPTYEEWGDKSIKVNGRIWIQVR